jgi:transposase
MNAKIQKSKSQACGYRNRQRFRDAIMFHLGMLDSYPQTASTHTDS